jgi:F0F1-type ATP synthase assembly protein I
MTETANPQGTEKQSGRMENALATARGATNDALHETRKAAERAGKAIEANPLAVVAGGIAIGLAAGALLPKTKRETELLGSVGKRLTGVAAGAAEAAREAAKAELGSLPLSKDAAKAQVSKLIDQVAKAVASAGEAALNGSPVEAPPIKPAKKSK